jgi:lia operon protein LiaG
MTRTSVFATLALVAVATAANAQTERRSLRGDRVAIYNLAGRLRVEGGAGSEVTVEITRGGRDASKLSVESGQVRGVESLRVIYPDDRIIYPEMGRSSRTSMSYNSDGTFNENNLSGLFGRRDQIEVRGSGSGTEAWADLRVTVPRGQRIELNLGVGQVNVTNVDGEISVDVAAASITANGVRGDLNLDTGSGSVNVTDVQGNVSLDTGSGGVTLTGVRGDRINLDSGSGSLQITDVDVRELMGDTGSGGIRLSRVKARRVSLDTGSGSTDVELLSEVEDLVIDTGSGGVTVRLPASIGATVDIQTGSGGVETDFPIQMNRFERNQLRGKIGNGNARIRIETGSGGVRLLKIG